VNSSESEEQVTEEERDENGTLALLHAKIRAKREVVIALKAIVKAKQAIADVGTMQKRLEGGQQNETRTHEILSTCLLNGGYDIGEAERVLNAVEKKTVELAKTVANNEDLRL